jgi:PhnB protein
MAVKGGLRIGQLGVTLIVQDVAGAAAFYVDVLGFEEVRRHSSPIPTDPPGPDVHSVELRLGNAYLIVARENPRWKDAPRPDWPRSPTSAGAASAAYTLYVDDVADVMERALAAGATPQTRRRTPEDTYWGDRVVQFYDPFGHIWRIQQRVEDVEFDDLPARFEAQRAAYRAVRPARE